MVKFFALSFGILLTLMSLPEQKNNIFGKFKYSIFGKLKKIIRKMHNWKAPGPNLVQYMWLFTSSVLKGVR